MAENPAPWRIEITTALCHVVDADGETVTAFSDDDVEFWERIVKAVNNHEALVKALEWAMARVIRDAPHREVEGDAELYAFAEAHALLAKLRFPVGGTR